MTRGQKTDPPHPQIVLTAVFAPRSLGGAGWCTRVNPVARFALVQFGWDFLVHGLGSSCESCKEKEWTGRTVTQEPHTAVPTDIERNGSSARTAHNF